MWFVLYGGYLRLERTVSGIEAVVCEGGGFFCPCLKMGAFDAEVVERPQSGVVTTVCLSMGCGRAFLRVSLKVVLFA